MDHERVGDIQPGEVCPGDIRQFRADLNSDHTTKSELCRDQERSSFPATQINESEVAAIDSEAVHDLQQNVFPAGLIASAKTRVGRGNRGLPNRQLSTRVGAVTSVEVVDGRSAQAAPEVACSSSPHAANSAFAGGSNDLCGQHTKVHTPSFPRSTLQCLGTRALFPHLVGDFESRETRKKLPPDGFSRFQTTRGSIDCSTGLMEVLSHAGCARAGCRT